MPRPLLALLLPALLLAACGQTPAAVPGATTPGATTPGTPAQQALPGVFQIDFSGVGTGTPTSQVQALQPGGLSAQGLISAPDQFSFSRVTTQTFTNDAAGLRHVRVTYRVTNTSSQTLRNPKFVAVVPQGSTTDSVFTNVRYFDGSDASAAISKLSLVQAQLFDASTETVTADPKTNPVLTGLDVSGVDITGKGIKTLTQTGWWLTTPVPSGRPTALFPGDSVLITFGVNVPMTSAANGGATKDPFSFSLNVTAVQDVVPPSQVALSSAVKQWDATSKTFGNYVKFPTQTYKEQGVEITRSLPAYYDIEELNDSTAKMLCGGDAKMSVTNISTASFPHRWRVQLLSLGEHTLNVFEGRSCPTSGNPLLSQKVTGVGTSLQSIAGGGNHSLALREDGTVHSWGSNTFGQLGDGTTTTQPSRVQVRDLSGITSVSAGGIHSLALRADGTVWSWGSNGQGQLGDGTNSDRATPVAVVGLSDLVSLSAGNFHSLALRADGTVWSWGNNVGGQLGDGTNTNRSAPVPVTGLSNVVSLTAGSSHSLALRADGTVWSWGANFAGQLGDTTNTNRSTPVPVSDLSGIRSISAGGAFSLALGTDGAVRSWGDNNSEQLAFSRPGFPSFSVNRPYTTDLREGITSIAAGEEYGVALREDGTVLIWGNQAGRFWSGTTGGSRPGPVSGMNGLTSIAAGRSHSLVLTADGNVRSWGINVSGQLGDGTTTSRTTVDSVRDLSRVAQPTP